MKLKATRQIVIDYIKQTFSYAQETNTQVDVFAVIPNSNLPKEAYTQPGLVHASFLNWTLEQVQIQEDGIDCILVYRETEYPIFIPYLQISSISDLGLESKTEDNFNPSKEQAQKSKKAFKFYRGEKI